MLTIDWQERLDALEYPPTHNYRVDSMEPRGALAQRVQIVQSFVDRGDRRESALEVGFNKGFFLHLFGRQFRAVDGCEPWREYFDLVDAIRTERSWPSIRHLHPGSFLDMPAPANDEPYDFIFLGNCMHYLFKEAGSYAFIERLAERCSGAMLIEGFTSLEGDDAYMIGSRRKWPIELQRRFTDEAFAEAIAPWFRRVDSHPSPTGPARRFMYLRRLTVSNEA